MSARTAVWQPIENVNPPGSTNPCEITEFCGGHVENNLYFDVCYFLRFSRVFAWIVWIFRGWFRCGVFFPDICVVNKCELLIWMTLGMF